MSLRVSASRTSRVEADVVAAMAAGQCRTTVRERTFAPESVATVFGRPRAGPSASSCAARSPARLLEVVPMTLRRIALAGAAGACALAPAAPAHAIGPLTDKPDTIDPVIRMAERAHDRARDRNLRLFRTN